MNKPVHPPSESVSSETGNMWADCCWDRLNSSTHPLYVQSAWDWSDQTSPKWDICRIRIGTGDLHRTGLDAPAQSLWLESSLQSPWVPLHLLLVAEAEEAGADALGHPRAAFVKEPLEDEETGHRDGEDELAERVHGHPPLLGTSSCYPGLFCHTHQTMMLQHTPNTTTTLQKCLLLISCLVICICFHSCWLVGVDR